MLIPIAFPQASSSRADYAPLPPHLARLGSDEVVIIELQGSLQVEGDKSGRLIGTLTIDPTNDSLAPKLMIGHHLLEGKIVTLPKPLAVLAKRTTPRPLLNINDEIREEGPQRGEDGHSSVEELKNSVSYDIQAIVRRKILFSKRPVPIVGAMSSIPGEGNAEGITSVNGMKGVNSVLMGK